MHTDGIFSLVFTFDPFFCPGFFQALLDKAFQVLAFLVTVLLKLCSCLILFFFFFFFFPPNFDLLKRTSTSMLTRGSPVSSLRDRYTKCICYFVIIFLPIYFLPPPHFLWFIWTWNLLNLLYVSKHHINHLGSVKPELASVLHLGYQKRIKVQTELNWEVVVFQK